MTLRMMNAKGISFVVVSVTSFGWFWIQLGSYSLGYWILVVMGGLVSRPLV